MRSLSNAQVLALLFIPVGCSLPQGEFTHPDVEVSRAPAAREANEQAPSAVVTSEEATPSDCPASSLTEAAGEAEMSALYEAACVEETFGPSGCVTTRVTRSFDPAGRVSKELFEVKDPDINLYTYMAVLPHVRTLTRDDDGRVVLDEIDEQMDGTVDTRISRSYDEQGRLTGESRLRWGSTEHSRYDEEGREVELVYELGDGYEWRTVRTFDDEGRPLSDEMTSDRPQDEGMLRRTVWSYDDEGRPLTKIYQHASAYGGGGSSTLTWIYEGGRAVRTLERTTQNGGYYGAQGDRVVVSFLDESGDAIRVEEDFPEDGAPDVITTRTFDEAGRPLSEHMSDGSGQSVFSNRSFRYDDEGRLLETIWGPSNAYYGVSGTTSERRSYDDAGLLSGIEYSRDGVVTSLTSFEHDALGQPTLEATDWDGDGAADYSRLWDRDAHGNLRFTGSEDPTGSTMQSRLSYACLETAPM